MHRLTKPAGEPKPAPNASEAERRALDNLLLTGKPTREESRLAVRYLLRQAGRNLAGKNA